MTAPIIVIVDGSQPSQDAVVLAARLADPEQDLLLVHVHPYDRLGDLLSGGERERLVRDVAESTATTVSDTLEPSVRRSMRLISNRSPAAGLHAVAAEVRASLIVVGSSKRAGLGKALSGGVAESVLTALRRPWRSLRGAPIGSSGRSGSGLTAQPRSKPTKIVVGYDGSSAAWRRRPDSVRRPIDLRWAARCMLARPCSSRRAVVLGCGHDMHFPRACRIDRICSSDPMADAGRDRDAVGDGPN